MIGHYDCAARPNGRRCSSQLQPSLPYVLLMSHSVCDFCTCNEAGQQVCLFLPIERLMPSRGPVVEIHMDRIRNQTEGSPYFE